MQIELLSLKSRTNSVIILNELEKKFQKYRFSIDPEPGGRWILTAYNVDFKDHEKLWSLFYWMGYYVRGLN